jgi:VanZ family protein
MPEENGLNFGRFATILTAGTLPMSSPGDEALESIEIWLEPWKIRGSQTILTFDGSDHPGAPFTLLQTGDRLRIQQHNVDPRNNSWTADSGVAGVFRTNTRVFITITLSAHQTTVYINGHLSTVFPISGVSSRNLTGRLVVGNSSVSGNSWTGQIFGLAVYRTQLTASQVARHYRGWTLERSAKFDDASVPSALYLFGERRGRVAHNEINALTDLQLPARYSVLHPRFLEPAWRRYQFGWPSWSYWQDVLLNIGGFVPLGFLVLNYLSRTGKIRHPTTTTFAVGFLLSLAIEMLQWFLPTRDSDMTDVISNTIGTALGLALYHSSIQRAFWNQIEGYITAAFMRAPNTHLFHAGNRGD